MTEKNVLIGFRWVDRNDRQWLFWLEKTLAGLGYRVSLVELPILSSSASLWLPEITKAHQISDNRIFLVRHDPGCLTILGYLKRLAVTKQVEPALLIAGQPKSNTVLDFVWADQKLLAGNQERGVAVSNENEIVKYMQGLDIKLLVIYGGNISESVNT